MHFNCLMEVNEKQIPASAMVRALAVRKASSQSHLEQNDQTTNGSVSQRGLSNKLVYPLRTSSILSHETYRDPTVSQLSATRPQVPSSPFDGEENSTATSGQFSCRCDFSVDAQLSKADSDQSNILCAKLPYLSDTSSAIMGNFVPIDSPNMAGLEPSMESPKAYLQSGPRRQAVKVNLYEFEPTTSYNRPTRQTTFNDFIKQGQELEYTYTPRSAHTKNAASEGNAVYEAQNSGHLAVRQSNSKSQGMYRCESSPNMAQIPFSSHRNAIPNPDVTQYDGEPRETSRQDYHGRSEDSNPRDEQDTGGNYTPRSPQRRYQDYANEPRSHSLARSSPQISSSKSHSTNRNLMQSPTKNLNNFHERDEQDEGSRSRLSDSPPPSPPKKRSRSPMKKMFGENGWLGYSADGKPDPRLQSKRSFVTRTDLANRPKKIGVMEKLKNKIEEMAEKADFSPMTRSRSNTIHGDKQRFSVLSISLSPPDQARIYMELELMLVHTANNFLMNQFSQGRMDVDSIKKAVDSWKSKGRPVVIEFMYDQATQRDIVVANQQNFRFQGEKAGNDIRINSMLYNWKQVATHMVTRTFCNADTVILKLLFDIEQILELLGAGEPMMIRLQQIRATSTELMRIARHNKDFSAHSQQLFRGREPHRVSSSLMGGNNIYDQSVDDPYGGLRLVPDGYAK